MAHLANFLLRWGTFRRLVASCAALVLLAGCVATGTTEQDPYESWNRNVFKLNLKLDNKIFKPVAVGYRKITPQPIIDGLDNSFSNFGELNTALNSALQGKGWQMLKTSARFLINSTLGIFGLFDVANEFGLAPHKEDFGQTLALWGVEAGPYIMLPVMGPSSMRDMFGLVPDSLASAVPTTNVGINTIGKRAIYLLGYGLNKRQGLLDLEAALIESGLDPYIAIRENYLAYRQQLVNDGELQPTELSAEEQDLLFDDDFDDGTIQ